ncbi:MAG: tRNA 4-thiouridine(8) synthase ThiI, partial [Eubacteriales bacterium]
TSILPYEDCCTVFTPRHPRTKPELEKVIEQEKKVDFDALVTEALEGAYYEYIPAEL